MDITQRDEKQDTVHDTEDEPGVGPEGDSSAAEKLPGAPAPDDDSPVGDTDQHAD